jgi:hypothetical protein
MHSTMEYLGEREDLDTLLNTLDAQALRQLLLDLAKDHQVVCDRLHRLEVAGDASALAARFTRHLDAWAHDHRYIRLEAVGAFNDELRVWLSQVEREVMPRFPADAMALFKAFIELDKSLFERADDSCDDIGTTFRQACRLWISAATAAGLEAADIRGRVADLLAGDNYGVRRELVTAAA